MARSFSPSLRVFKTLIPARDFSKEVKKCDRQWTRYTGSSSASEFLFSCLRKVVRARRAKLTSRRRR